jgi:hypothetical protein
MKTLGAIVLVVLIGALGYAWWNQGPKIRYRLTVTVESGGKAYTSSGVIEIKMLLQDYWSPAVSHSVTGDAVVVSVPDRSPVFVLLTRPTDGDWPGSLPFEIFAESLGRSTPLRDRAYALARMHDKVELPPTQYPTMVAFRDINDPKSVYEVFPDDLSPPLDKGAHLVGMTIEMTRDPVTYQVEKTLPWLPTVYDQHLDGDRYHRFGKSFANSLSQADFMKRGT